MVSENPPRRSKSEKEPLTIDLQAEKTAADEAESVASHESVTDEPAEISANQAESENAADAADPADGREQTEEERADAAAAAFDEEPPHLSNEATAQPTLQRQATSAGALAAGILGGLVALVGAGVLQYAGYIPPLGPDRGNAGLEQNLASEIEAIKTQITSQSASATDIGPLENRLAALEQAAKQPGAAGASAPQITALEAEVANLTKEVAGLKASLADAEQSAAAAKAELAGRIDQAEQKLNEPVNDIQMAKAVAVTALKTAIDRGGPFLAELDALRSIAPDDATVKDL
ncbi:hypothetical protein I6F07_32970, partial [Ensifer sp. IC4062]